MKKRPLAAVLKTVGTSTGDHVIKDTTSGLWGIKKTAAGNELLLGMYAIAALRRIESLPSVAEVRQVVLLGASATKDAIAASTRYKIEIGNPEDRYETFRRFPAVHAYTTAAALSGNADTDRLNVFTALVNKVNAYGGNNATAYLLHEFDFTGGSDTGDGVPTIGAQYEQATSLATAILAKYELSSGTFAGDNAAGTAWVYQDDTCSGTISASALNWTGETTIDFDQTVSTLVEGTGMAVVDDAGYFISSIGRAGANWVGATQGFVNSQFEVAIDPVYAMGIGTVMAALAPRYDASKQDAQFGSLDFELVDNETFVAGQTYKKYVFTFLDGDENALSSEREHAYSQVILWADEGQTLTQMETDIAALLT